MGYKSYTSLKFWLKNILSLWSWGHMMLFLYLIIIKIMKYFFLEFLNYRQFKKIWEVMLKFFLYIFKSLILKSWKVFFSYNFTNIDLCKIMFIFSQNFPKLHIKIVSVNLDVIHEKCQCHIRSIYRYKSSTISMKIYANAVEEINFHIQWILFSFILNSYSLFPSTIFFSLISYSTIFFSTLSYSTIFSSTISFVILDL